MTFQAGLRPLTTHRRRAASCAWATGSCCSFTWSSARPTSPRSPMPSTRSTPPSTTTSRPKSSSPTANSSSSALTSSSSSETRSPGKASLSRFAPGWPSTATRSAKSSKTLWSAPRRQPCSTPHQGPPETWRKGCGSSRDAHSSSAWRSISYWPCECRGERAPGQYRHTACFKLTGQMYPVPQAFYLQKGQNA